MRPVRKRPPVLLGCLAAAGLAALVLAGGCAVPGAAPGNLSILKAEIRSYVTSGRYERDIGRVAADARRWLDERAARRQPGERLALVLDLDETLWSNWEVMNRLDLGYVPAEWDRWVESAAAPAIPPVKDLFLAAGTRDVAVILVTARPERQRAATERNLRAIGCGGHARLVCQPDGDQRTAAAFKAAARRMLAGEGWTIMANVGDQASDLAGGFAERTFLLPNPIYLTE